MTESAILILFTLAVVAMIDYVPRLFVSSAKKTIKTLERRGKIPDFLIMPTVYGNISYLQNISFLKKYADKVLICTSTHETPEFYRDLRKVCMQYGFRYAKAELPVGGGKPIKNAYTIYAGIFKNQNKLRVPHDTPCVLIDADTYSKQNVNNLIRTFKAHELDIASLRCEVANPKTTIEVLQDFEYTLAMDNRRMDPWLTSGACNMARASVFRHVFANHSRFFAGGDIEIGKLAQVMGYKIRHIPFVFYTAAPDTFKQWFNQRIIWFAGGFRHHVVNLSSFSWHHFFMLFYNSLIIYLLLPLRWIELINFPLTLLVLIGLSWVYLAILIHGKRRWRKEYLLLPFYSFLQSMIILPRGIMRYCKLAWTQRSLGLLRYDLKVKSVSTKILFKILNISSASMILYVAVTFTIARVGYWLHNGYIMHFFAR